MPPVTYPAPPDGSSATFAILAVASAAARLALPQECALGRAVREADTGCIYALVPNGNAATAGDWVMLFGVMVLDSAPLMDTKATGTLTMAGNMVANKIVTIGDRVYTARANPAAANEFKVGADAGASLDNLIAAINGAAGAGTLYGTGTVAHALVTGSAGAGDTLVATAKDYGIAGNAIVSTTNANGSWGAATLAGGVTGTVPAYLGQEAIVGDYFYKATSIFPAVWIGPIPAEVIT